jgi:hypothetical protein
MTIIPRLVRKAFARLRRPIQFVDSPNYWENRYRNGGDSGDGSYGKLARFKADVLNAFVVKHNISSVIEFGSGDGSQLALASYPSYIGFDVSETAVAACRRKFPQHSFRLMRELASERADLTLSLDVIYHLVEDAIFESYMRTLFGASNRFVVIYSSNHEGRDAPHIRHRKFTDWISRNARDWALLEHIPNKHPYQPGVRGGSFADFYIYGKPN